MKSADKLTFKDLKASRNIVRPILYTGIIAVLAVFSNSLAQNTNSFPDIDTTTAENNAPNINEPGITRIGSFKIDGIQHYITIYGCPLSEARNGLLPYKRGDGHYDFIGLCATTTHGPAGHYQLRTSPLKRDFDMSSTKRCANCHLTGNPDDNDLKPIIFEANPGFEKKDGTHPDGFGVNITTNYGYSTQVGETDSLGYFTSTLGMLPEAEQIKLVPHLRDIAESVNTFVQGRIKKD